MKRLLWAAVACLTPAAAWSADYTVTSNLPSKYTVTSNLPPKAPAAPAAKKRVRYAGYWWDEFPDGRLLWCTECNGPYPAAGVPGVVVVDWNGGKPPAPGVAAPASPFPDTTPATGATPVAAPSSSSPAPVPYRAPTGTFAPAGIRGSISRPCPPAG